MDDDDWDDDDDAGYEDYPRLSWSWRTLVHNTLHAVSMTIGVAEDYVESCAGQFGCAGVKWRADQEKLEAADEARRLLSALDEL